MRGISVDGVALRTLRQEQGLTQEALAGRVGCDIKTIRTAERGGRVDASTIRHIADGLGVAVAAVVLSAGDSQQDSERNIQLFHDWQVASNNRDVEALVRFYRPDATLVVPGAEDLPGGGRREGVEAIRRHFTDSFAAFVTEQLGPDRYKVDAAGQYVFARGTATATALATGQQFTAAAVHELEIEDGLILSHTIVVDTSGVRRSLRSDGAS